MARVQIINPISQAPISQAQAAPAPAQAPPGMEALYRLFGLQMPVAPGAAPDAASSSQPFGGFLGGLAGMMPNAAQPQVPQGQALRQRPADIERLVSMSQSARGTNAGGFFGGMFDDKG